jgi:quercetin dioxygenase-like cupin family protein
MDYSRREWALFPLLAAAVAQAKGQSPALPSKVYPFENLAVKVSGPNNTRSVLNGETHAGMAVEMHITELGPGEAPHPPHHHEHEELLMIRDGTVEVTIAGNSTKLGPGSSAYVASNEVHGWRNVGLSRASYFVVAFGKG